MAYQLPEAPPPPKEPPPPEKPPPPPPRIRRRQPPPPPNPPKPPPPVHQPPPPWLRKRLRRKRIGRMTKNAEEDRQRQARAELLALASLTSLVHGRARSPCTRPCRGHHRARLPPSTPPGSRPSRNRGTISPSMIRCAVASGIDALEAVAHLDADLPVLREDEEDRAVVLLLLARAPLLGGADGEVLEREALGNLPVDPDEDLVGGVPLELLEPRVQRLGLARAEDAGAVGDVPRGLRRDLLVVAVGRATAANAEPPAPAGNAAPRLTATCLRPPACAAPGCRSLRRRRRRRRVAEVELHLRRLLRPRRRGLEVRLLLEPEQARHEVRREPLEDGVVLPAPTR